MRAFFTYRLAATLGFCSVATVLAGPALAVPRIEVVQALPATDGSEVGETRIVVDGKQGGPYDEVKTETVEVWVRSTLPKLPDERRTTAMRIEIEGEVYERDDWGGLGQPVSFATQRLLFAFPYVNPLPGSNAGAVVNVRRSPIDFCNQQLASRSGQARTNFLSRGHEGKILNAYLIEAWAKAEWYTKVKGRMGFSDSFENHNESYDVKAFAGATIECKALNRPRPRTETTTQGANSGRTGKRMEPTISLATLRIEPAAKQVIGDQLCPTQLRLYGRVQTIRAFEGKAVIFGTAYFSPVSQLNFTHGGNRNLIATYPLKWDNMGGKAAAGAQPPRNQNVSLTMNVTTMDNKVLKQALETVTVTCRPIAQIALLNLPLEPTGPQPSAQLTTAVAPPVTATGFSWNRPAATAPAAALIAAKPLAGTNGARLRPGIDLAIRRVDRGGPGGATRLWLRNGGDAAARSCRVLAKRKEQVGWIEIQGWDNVVEPGATIELAAVLPNDPNLVFVVDCAGEPVDRLADNLKNLP